jgi:tRNA uridine 5-carboxymethylaminomethyl modification enzyme
LLEKTKLTGKMLAQLGNSPARVGADAPVCTAERSSSAVASEERLTTDDRIGQPLAQLLKRPEITVEELAPILQDLAPDFFSRNGDSGPAVIRENPRESVAAPRIHIPSAVRNELKSVETEIKYAGYLHQQQRSIDRLKKAEQRNIPEWFDYRSVSGLSREMQEKLFKIRPRTLGHAARIPGVTPAAVSLVNVYIEIQARRREQAATI